MTDSASGFQCQTQYMWSFHERLSSICTRNDFTHFTCFIALPLIVRNVVINCSHKLSSYSEHQLRRRDIYVKNYRGTGYLGGGGLTRYGIFQKIRTHWVRVVVQ